MRIDRRELLNRAALALVAGMSAGAVPSLSHALSDGEAAAHVQATIGEVSSLLESQGSSTAKAQRLLSIMEQRAAMPEIARFAAGLAWRSMDDSQQARFTTAFGKNLSETYAARFQEYAGTGGTGGTGETFRLGGVVDAGRKGMLVKTSILRVSETPVQVDWLVTDRPGRVVIADIVIEGISMLVTEREEIGGMLEARGGDVEKLIADLGS